MAGLTSLIAVHRGSAWRQVHTLCYQQAGGGFGFGFQQQQSWQAASSRAHTSGSMPTLNVSAALAHLRHVIPPAATSQAPGSAPPQWPASRPPFQSGAAMPTATAGPQQQQHQPQFAAMPHAPSTAQQPPAVVQPLPPALRPILDQPPVYTPPAQQPLGLPKQQSRLPAPCFVFRSGMGAAGRAIAAAEMQQAQKEQHAAAEQQQQEGGQATPSGRVGRKKRRKLEKEAALLAADAQRAMAQVAICEEGSGAAAAAGEVAAELDAELVRMAAAVRTASPLSGKKKKKLLRAMSAVGEPEGAKGRKRKRSAAGDRCKCCMLLSACQLLSPACMPPIVSAASVLGCTPDECDKSVSACLQRSMLVCETYVKAVRLALLRLFMHAGGGAHVQRGAAHLPGIRHLRLPGSQPRHHPQLHARLAAAGQQLPHPGAPRALLPLLTR